MVRRHGGLSFGPGALVFPGGKLDAQDHDPAWAGRVKTSDQADRALWPLRVCATREAFEETGILLGVEASSHPSVQAEAARRRPLVLGGEMTFLDVFARLGGRLQLSALAPFARWITPEASPIRFDATFFICKAPADQVAVCDGRETVEAEWLQPEQALRLGKAGERKLMHPTRMCLQVLAQAADADDAIASARTRVVTSQLGPGANASDLL